MWIAKGLFLGLWLFGYATIIELYAAVYRHTPSNSAVSIHVITSLTSSNPWWWTTCAVCLIFGCLIARIWSVPCAIWIGLAVTGLIPVSFLTLFVVLVAKLKAIAPGS